VKKGEYPPAFGDMPMSYCELDDMKWFIILRLICWLRCCCCAIMAAAALAAELLRNIPFEFIIIFEFDEALGVN